MKNKETTVKISIMQRDFTVACDPQERQSLIEAAAYLDKQMRKISKSGKVLGVDRCAIMVALNISHDLLQLRESVGENSNLSARIVKLYDRVNQAVTEHQQVTL